MNSHQPTVLVIDDEPQIRRFLRATLTQHQYHVIEAATAQEGMTQALSRVPDIILLDLGLPDQDGIDVTRQVRAWAQIPIIVISARGQERDKVAALDAGADDYVTKPFGMDELLARMRVALRHSQRAMQQPAEQQVTVGDLCIDFERRQITMAGSEIRLTPTGYKLLATLAHHIGKVVTQQQLLEAVWGPKYVNEAQYLRVYMGQLRHKLEADPARPRYLVTEPGVGYRLRAE
jgi:two-component system KDP operon response regulator KdpE